jgi:protein-L-isoaspartate(D-aspartate) O-methyltransferase
MRGEDAVIAHQVDRRAGRDRGELLQQFDGLEEEMRGAIAPDRLQRDEDAPVGPERDAVLAVAREVVGPEGLVVSIEIDPVTFAFAKQNLEDAGYHDVVLVQGDGGLGYRAMSPYDRIAVTAACPKIPPPLLEQLSFGGRLIAPVLEDGAKNLVLVENSNTGLKRKGICEVLYVSLRGRCGA